LLVAETREVARLLLQGGGPDVWKKAIIYVRKDPYGPISGDPEEIRYWANFCKTAKNKQRFTFFFDS